MLAATNAHFSQQQLFDETDVLPIDLKTKLVDKLLNSLSPTDKLVDEQWLHGEPISFCCYPHPFSSLVLVRCFVAPTSI